MARGPSGRLVLEIDPKVKRQIHARVASEGRTLKEWFLEQVEQYLRRPEQMDLALDGKAAGESLDRSRKSSGEHPAH